MAGANFVKGGRRDILITKKPIPNNPAYLVSGANKKIDKQSQAQLQSTNITPGKIKIGVRVKQSENVEQFEIKGNGRTLALTPAPPQESPSNNPVALDLGAALGVGSDEKWVTYSADYDPGTFGKTFTTKLVLSPFDCHPNGVRIFTVAITYDSLSFTNDHYVYGLSILPGENSKAFPIDITVTRTPKKPAPKAKAAKKAKKAPKRRMPRKRR